MERLACNKTRSVCRRCDFFFAACMSRASSVFHDISVPVYVSRPQDEARLARLRQVGNVSGGQSNGQAAYRAA